MHVPKCIPKFSESPMCVNLQDTRVGDFSCAVSASANVGSVAYNTCLIAKYFPANPTIYDRAYTGIGSSRSSTHTVGPQE